jgi:hypothetical protein
VLLRKTLLAVKLQQAILRASIEKAQREHQRNSTNFEKIRRLDHSSVVTPETLASRFFSIEPVY